MVSEPLCYFLVRSPFFESRCCALFHFFPPSVFFFLRPICLRWWVAICSSLCNSLIEMKTISSSLSATASSDSSHMSNLATISLSFSVDNPPLQIIQHRLNGNNFHECFKSVLLVIRGKGRLFTWMVLFFHHGKVRPTTVPGRPTTPLSWLG